MLCVLGVKSARLPNPVTYLQFMLTNLRTTTFYVTNCSSNASALLTSIAPDDAPPPPSILLAPPDSQRPAIGSTPVRLVPQALDYVHRGASLGAQFARSSAAVGVILHNLTAFDLAPHFVDTRLPDFTLTHEPFEPLHALALPPPGQPLELLFKILEDKCQEHLVTVGGATVQARAAALRRLGLVADGCDAPARRRVARRALQCLGDGSAACLRKAAAIVLTRLSEHWEENQPGVAVVLEPALADDDVTVSTMAAKALACVAPKNEAVAAALRQLTHPSPKVRAAALGVLGQVAVRTRLVVRRVIEMLVDLDWQVRAAACRALPRVVERGESSAAEALQAALTKDLDGRVRRAAAGALVHVVPHPSLPFLILKAEEAKQVKRKMERRFRARQLSTCSGSSGSCSRGV
ncbi:Hypothetical protein SCF082_LOCUS42465 [Durusdinium trenchii]|uniref:Condensin complex subunit 1 C-terminal domain-containing protein n=1 Tax=Durusdinium trenchii TaxID=1381693 RepID=A0ABP0QPC9_9DINO